MKRSLRAAPRANTGEAMVVWCTAFALLLLPLGGLSVDLWHGVAVQRQLQAAAEDAAIAGASGVDVAAYRATGCILLSPVLASGLASENLAQQALPPSVDVRITVALGGRQISVWLQERVHLTLLSLVMGGRPLVVAASGESAPRGTLSGASCTQLPRGPG